MNKKTLYLVQGGIIAALYVVLVQVFGFSSFGPIQFRVAEGLTILPFFTPAAIPGLFIGCLIANILGGAVWLDVVFGSLATLAAAYLSYRLRKLKWLVPVPPVVLNAMVVPLVLRYGYQLPDAILYMAFTVFAGEMITAYGLGMILLHVLKPIKHLVFKQTEKQPQ